MDEVKYVDESCIDTLLNTLRKSDTEKTPGDLARETTSNDVTICTYLNSLYNDDIVKFSDDGDGYRRYFMTEFGKTLTNDEIKEIIKTKVKVKVKKYRCKVYKKNTGLYRIVSLLKMTKDVKKRYCVSFDYVYNNKDFEMSTQYLYQIFHMLRKTGYVENMYRGYYKFTELFDNNNVEKIVNDMTVYQTGVYKKGVEKRKAKNKDNIEKKTQPQDIRAEENTINNVEEKSDLEKLYDIIKNNRDMEGIKLSDINKIHIMCSYDGVMNYEIEAGVDGSFVVLSVTNGK